MSSFSVGVIHLKPEMREPDSSLIKRRVHSYRRIHRWTNDGMKVFVVITISSLFLAKADRKWGVNTSFRSSDLLRKRSIFLFQIRRQSSQLDVQIGYVSSLIRQIRYSFIPVVEQWRNRSSRRISPSRCSSIRSANDERTRPDENRIDSYLHRWRCRAIWNCSIGSNHGREIVRYVLHIALRNFSAYNFDNIARRWTRVVHADEYLLRSDHFYRYWLNDEYAKETGLSGRRCSRPFDFSSMLHHWRYCYHLIESSEIPCSVHANWSCLWSETRWARRSQTMRSSSFSLTPERNVRSICAWRIGSD